MRALDVRLIAALFMAFAASAGPALADCILYGDTWAVTLTTPQGWEMECFGPSGQVEVALYPSGSTWATADIVMYVNSSHPVADQTLAQFAEWELAKFKKKHPGLGVLDGGVLQTADKRQVLLRVLQGDNWGNFEAVAYVEGRDTRLIVVLSSKSKERYDGALADLRALVSTMVFIAEVGAGP